MTSPPDGLSKEAWVLASIYLAAIIGLVSKPYPENSLFICIRWLHYPLWRRGRSIIFATGYNDIKSWWITGTIVAY
jgi:di/tricarboxylate transporter